MIDWSVLEVTEIPAHITELAEKRLEAKKMKDFSLADNLRKEIEEVGFSLIDQKDGFVIEKK